MDFLLGGVMKKSNSAVALMTEIALLAAVGFVLDELSSVLFKGIFFNGGSIGIAMVAVLIIAFRRGPIPAILTGLIIGGFDVMTSAYIVHPFQVFLDYIFPYALVGFAGMFKYYYDKYQVKWMQVVFIIAGTLLGSTLKFFSHFSSGVIFFVTAPTDLWGLSAVQPALYSFIYNAAYIFPSAIISGGIMVAIYFKAPKLLQADQYVPTNYVDDRGPFAYVSSSVLAVSGTFLFIYYLIKYVNSYGAYQDGDAWGYEFDPDSMVILSLGLFTMISGLIALIKIKRERHSNTFLMGTFSVISFVALVYGIARLIKMIVKEKDPTIYIIWIVIGTITLALSIFLAIRSHKNRNIRVPRA